MNLFNPSEDVLEHRFNGFMVVIGPGEQKAVSDDCGKFMLQKMSNYGLVSVDYTEKEEKQYGSIAEYKKVKRMEGLKKYKDWMQQCLSQEQVFPREVSQKNGGEVELSNTKVPYFKNKIKKIEALLTVKEPDKIEIKKGGRPRKVINVNESAATSESSSVS